ncbi:hypothetical protein [Embleya sp. NBC_00896]|uniref:hypothetical protein n=1 Tax=Embleya sp. NBC_00896 TaxID=2975961 RepID=UPI00386F33BC|nr:hypothetical protein OG928_23860 [Embleya sp. NBC_00896]
MDRLVMRKDSGVVIHRINVTITRADASMDGTIVRMITECAECTVSGNTMTQVMGGVGAELNFEHQAMWTPALPDPVNGTQSTLQFTMKYEMKTPIADAEIPGGWKPARNPRCDNSLNLATPGCVIPEYVPTADVSRSGSSSAMIYYAQTQMAGAWGLRLANGKGKPLTRSQADSVEAGKSWGDMSRQVICKRKYNHDPSFPAADDPSCDEYPFAATFQSAGKGGFARLGAVDDGSVCTQVVATRPSTGAPYDNIRVVGTADPAAPCIRGTIPLGQNTDAGRAIASTFISNSHVLRGDNFWVHAAPQGGWGNCATVAQPTTPLAATFDIPLCGPILDAFNHAGGAGAVGYPVAQGSTSDGQGKYIHFQARGAAEPSASIYWSPATGAHEIAGNIRAKWLRLGAETTLGYPITDETTTPDGQGRFNHFSDGDTSIYSTPTGGAWQIGGAIRDKWAELGWERGLGYPDTDESTTSDGVGRFNHFRRLGASTGDDSIYWTPDTGAHQIGGAIRDKWMAGGSEQGAGYPTTDETGTPDGQGRFNHFRGPGMDEESESIYWHPKVGVSRILAGFRDKWLTFGAEQASGYPVGDETGTGSSEGAEQYTARIDAQGNAYLFLRFLWGPDSGTHFTPASWRNYPGPNSWMGFPTKEHAYDPGEPIANFYTFQSFEGGCLGKYTSTPAGQIDAVANSTDLCREDYQEITPDTWNNRMLREKLPMELNPVPLNSVLGPDGQISADKLRAATAEQ